MLTPAQQKRLIDGKRVVMSAEAIATDGGVAVFLTAQQINRLTKVHSEGKGMSLQISATLAEYNRKHAADLHARFGAGLFSDVVDVARNGAVDVAQGATRLGVDAVANVVQKQVGSKLGPLEGLFNKGISIGSKYGAEQLVALLNGLRASKNGGSIFEVRGERLYIPMRQIY
jgi:hypothetical protein